MDKQWYVIHTYSGHENKVKTSLEERFNILGLRDRVGQILVPMEDVVEIKGGKAEGLVSEVFSRVSPDRSRDE